MILVYSADNSSRFTYTINLFFGSIIQAEYNLTDSVSDYDNFDGPKLSYSPKKPTSGLWIKPSGLLFSSEITKQELKPEEFEDLIIFYQTENECTLPFDVFAAGFYLATRYEEYTIASRDRHGRFESKNSIAFQHDFLDKAMVNRYALTLKRKFEATFENCTFKQLAPSYVSTIDIDNAYAYKYKGVAKNAGTLLKKLIRLDFKNFSRQLRVLSRMKKDPYDSYEKQEQLHQRYKIQPLYFWLLGNKGKHDRNLSHRNKSLQELILRLQKSGKANIHPSYASNKSKARLQNEIHRLESITQKPVTESRQHFIMLKIPETYQRLVECGITDDFSMGYASIKGFRASMATPFKFYNLSTETATELTIHPFCMMDTTLKFYQKIKAKKIMEKIEPLFVETELVKGQFVSVFHNESIGAKGIWKNWKGMYENVLYRGSEMK